jgi:hypothetical protein
MLLMSSWPKRDEQFGIEARSNRGSRAGSWSRHQVAAIEMSVAIADARSPKRSGPSEGIA